MPLSVLVPLELCVGQWSCEFKGAVARQLHFIAPGIRALDTLRRRVYPLNSNESEPGSADISRTFAEYCVCVNFLYGRHLARCGLREDSIIGRAHERLDLLSSAAALPSYDEGLATSRCSRFYGFLLRGHLTFSNLLDIPRNNVQFFINLMNNWWYVTSRKIYYPSSDIGNSVVSVSNTVFTKLIEPFHLKPWGREVTRRDMDYSQG